MSSSVEKSFTAAVLLTWDGKLALADLVGLANELEQNNLKALAAVLYQTWLKRQRTPQDHFVWFNLGVILSDAKDFAAAREAYEQALALAPNFYQPRFNLGIVCEKLGDLETSLHHWRWISEQAGEENVESKGILILALNNLGRVLEGLKQYQEALRYLNRSLALEPNQPDVLHHWIFIREKQCLWPVYAPLPGVSLELMQKSTSALAMLSLSDAPEEQLAAACNYVATKMSTTQPQLAPTSPYRHKKIRIGYCSSDFCLHPVSMLTVELFELHDREHFEIYGYCWTQEDGSGLRQRVIQAMDHFFPIGELDDIAAAKLIREHEIDILIDLHGQTKGARPHILAYRPAPIQITYLGLPATTGLPCIDYVIADRFLIPEDCAQYYSEVPLYMPDVYQVCDRHRKVSDIPSRISCGLPEDAFVFCSFNNNYKFTPEVFSTWMKILHQVPHSILWLLSDNPWAEENLRKEAELHGIDGKRLIFAPRVLPEDYLARYAAADLFLDTYPFNAGTTANDALWMGLPVLTLSGKTFASRMAGALLTAAKLSELITYDLLDYEKKAIQLATTPAKYKRLREKLKNARDKSPLFDTPRFVKNLEKSLKKLIGDRK